MSEGQELKLKIISLDSERHRLGLSLKQTEDRSTPMVQPRYEERADRPEGGERPPEPSQRNDRVERTDRAERGDRRDRRGGRGRDRDYRPEDATAEPEEGIDNTMAAAFVESGLLDQFRTEEPATEVPAVSAVAEAAAEEPAVAEAAAEEPAVAEAVAEETVAVEAVAEEPVAVEAVAEEPAVVEVAAEVKAAAPAKSRKRKTAAAETPAEPAPGEAPASSEPEAG